MRALARLLQMAGLIVTGIGFFDGVIAGNARRELLLLGLGMALFFGGRALQGMER